MSTIDKRSMRIAGKRTSVALEQPFWAEIERAARIHGTSIPVYIANVDKAKPADQSLASALRCHILKQRTRAA